MTRTDREHAARLAVRLVEVADRLRDLLDVETPDLRLVEQLQRETAAEVAHAVMRLPDEKRRAVLRSVQNCPRTGQD